MEITDNNTQIFLGLVTKQEKWWKEDFFFLSGAPKSPKNVFLMENSKLIVTSSKEKGSSEKIKQPLGITLR